MKKVIILTICFLSIINILTACSPSKADVIQDMLAPKGTYNIYVFWDGDITDYSELTEEMLSIINSEDIIESLSINNMTFINVNDKTQKYNYKDIFNIKQSPTIIVLNDEKIILETNDSTEVNMLSDKP